MALCSLSDLMSWFSCAESRVYFGELLTIAIVSAVFFSFRDKTGASDLYDAAIPSLALGSLISGTLYALGASNGYFTVAMFMLTGLAALGRKIS